MGNINGFEDYLESHFFDEEKSRKLTKRLIKDFVNTLATYPKLFNKKTSLERNIFDIIRRLLANHWNVSDYDGCKEVLDLAKNIPVHDKKQLENFIAKMTKTIHIKIKLSDIEAIHDERRRKQKIRDLLHFGISKDVYWDGNGLSRKEKELYRILLTEISDDDDINEVLVKNYDQITHPAKKYKSEIIEGHSWNFYLPFEFYNLNLTKIYDHIQRNGLNEKKGKEKSTLTPTRLYHQIVEDNPEWKDKLSEGWELWKEKNNHDNKNKNSETKKPSVRETKMAEFRNANKQ